jgi:hypothetical protein
MAIKRFIKRPLAEKIINSVADLTESGGKYIIDDLTNYIFSGGIFALDKPLDCSAVANLTVIDFYFSQIIYTGSGACIQGSFDGALQIQDAVIIGSGTEIAYDITGNLASQTSAFISDNVAFIFFGQTGSISNVTGIRFFLVTTGITTGLILNNCGRVSLNDSALTSISTSNSPKFHLNGSFGVVQINNSLTTSFTGESFISFSPDFTVSENVVVSANSYSLASSSDFFDPGHSGSITAFSDAGGGITTVTTSAAHGITIQQKVVITGTTNYNGTFTITNASGSTFDINTAFVADDATGSFDTGDSSIRLDQNCFEFRSNGDQIDSNEVGTMSVTTPFTVTITTANTPVQANGSNWTSDILRRFSFATASLTYTGIKSLPFQAVGTITLDSVSGNDQLSAYIAVNGTVISESRATATAGTQTTFTPSTIIDLLNTGDVVSLYVENNTDTSNINVQFGNVELHKI